MKLKTKASLIKKNPDIKAGVIENEENYNNYSDIISKINKSESMSVNMLDNLIQDINKLDREDHLKIYILLRSKGVTEKFFSRSKKATHFDIEKIPDDVKWVLYMNVQMLEENKSRNKIISDLTEEHQNKINTLDTKLKTPHSHSNVGLEKRSESENEKFEKMLKLNKNMS